jgi:uncharacterized protein (DUF433 family)
MREDTSSCYHGDHVSRQEATLSEIHRITVDAQICGGRPSLRGMRIRVKDILDLLAAGASRAEILADYPLLEDGDITAALEYARLHHARH